MKKRELIHKLQVSLTEKVVESKKKYKRHKKHKKDD